DRAQAAGAFVGGLTGTALGVGIGRNMTEADAVGAAFGSDIGTLIGWGVAEAIRGRETCTVNPNDPFASPQCSRNLSDRSEVAIMINSDDPGPHLVLGLASVGALAGLIVTERYLDPAADAGQPRFRVTFNPASIALMAARTPGNHSLFNVRF